MNSYGIYQTLQLYNQGFWSSAGGESASKLRYMAVGRIQVFICCYLGPSIFGLVSLSVEEVTTWQLALSV